MGGIEVCNAAPNIEKIVHPCCKVGFWHLTVRFALKGFIVIFSLAGISRSVTVTLAYIITVTHHNWRDALSAVRWSRECANPNLGFISQLRKYEAEQVEEVNGSQVLINAFTVS